MKAGLATDKWKTSLVDYTEAAKELCASMASHGFLPQGAIPIDPDGELLDGSHRVACAMALELKAVSVIRETRKAWAPPWGEAWFVDNGCPADDLDRIRQDWKSLAA
jgi:hypothetical protein